MWELSYERLRRERIKKVHCVFVIIIASNIKIQISTQNNFVIAISRNILSSDNGKRTVVQTMGRE